MRTDFADIPDDRDERRVDVLRGDAPPRGYAVHSCVYRDDECCLNFTFVAPLALTTFRHPLLTYADPN